MSLNKQETICVHTLSGKFNLDNLQIWEKYSVNSLWALFPLELAKALPVFPQPWLGSNMCTQSSPCNLAPAANATQSIVSPWELLLESHLWFPGWCRHLHSCENNTQLCYQKCKLLELCAGRKKIKTCTAFRLSLWGENVQN